MTTPEMPYITPRQYLNKHGRVILNDLRFGNHNFYPFILTLGYPNVYVKDANEPDYKFDAAQLEHLLQRSTKLERADLWHILKNVHYILGYTGAKVWRYPQECCDYPGYSELGRVVVDLEKWTLSWQMNLGQTHSQHLRKSTAGCQSFLSPNQTYHFQLDHKTCDNPEHTYQLVLSWLVQRLMLPNYHSELDFSQELSFWIIIHPCKNYLPNHMVEAASLSIICKAPVITSQSPPKMSWPFSFVVDGVPMSPKEVEEMFRIRIDMGCQSNGYNMWEFNAGSPDICELSAMCGFDPALNGADICSYFDLFPLEIFDEAHTNLDDLAAIDKTPMSDNIEILNLFESDTDDSEDEELEDQVLSESDSTHSVEEIDSNFPTDIGLSFPNAIIASILPHFDSEDLHSWKSQNLLPLVKDSQTEHRSDQKGKCKATSEEMQQDRDKKNRFHLGSYIRQCNKEITQNSASTGMTILFANQSIDQILASGGQYNWEGGNTTGIINKDTAMVSLERASFTFPSVSHTLGSASISEASPGQWLDYPGIQFPYLNDWHNGSSNVQETDSTATMN
ncbi:hypothetical protein ARMGADRAFT_80163 [Armillaria gallica]|uniref:Uncharacterized protein n=1 Tax=Armillaria gallica TaxID=47427 RepID=A0A2H3CUB5_ARMGA|nr:hypothetical protein ARMGADRAFT_80163 [Armillaria gallica]